MVLFVFSTWSRYCQDVAPVLANYMRTYPTVYFCAVSLETAASIRVYLHSFPGLSLLNVASDAGHEVQRFLERQAVASVPYAFAFTPARVLFWSGHILSPRFEAGLVQMVGPPREDAREAERRFVEGALSFDGTRPRGLPAPASSRAGAAERTPAESGRVEGGLGTPGFSFWSLTAGLSPGLPPLRSGSPAARRPAAASRREADEAELEEMYGLDPALKYMRALSPNLESPSRERQLRSRRAISPPPRMLRSAAFLQDVNRRLDGMGPASRASLSPAFRGGATLMSLRDMTDPTVNQQATSVVPPAPERVTTVPELSYVALSLTGESRAVPGVTHPRRASPTPGMRAGVTDSYVVYDPCGRKALSPVAVRRYAPTHSFVPDDPGGRGGEGGEGVDHMLQRTRRLARLDYFGK